MEYRKYPLNHKELEIAKDHLTRTLDLLMDGGVWLIPASGSSYKVDKKRKALIHAGGPVDAITIQTAQAIGYTVIWRDPRNN